MMVCTFFYAVVFLISCVILVGAFSSSKAHHLPPCPNGSLPVIGHLHLLNNTPHQSFHHLCSRYGPLIHLRLGSTLCVIASNSHLAKELLVTNGLAFSSRPINIATHLLTYKSAGFGFAPYGPYWQFMKKIVTSELLGDKSLAQFQYIRFNETSQLVRLLLNQAKSGKVVNVSEEITKVSNNIISRMMLGIRCSGEDEQAKEIRGLVREATGILAQFNLSDFVPFFRNLDLQGIRKKAMNLHFRYNSLLEGIIKEREGVRKKSREKEGGGDEAKDFLEILLDISEDESAKVRLTRDHIKAFMFDFLTAGTDTSAISVEWGLSELINNPTILEKARQEIDSVVGKNRLVKESDIQNLPYLQAIFKETLRLHPPVPIFERESTQDCKIDGYDIPAKTILFINNWSISRDPNNWKNPFEFQPERFIEEGDGGIDVRGQHFELLPFGSGRRGCPGVSLAVIVVPTMLALLVQCFDWKIACKDGDQVVVPKVVDMTERPGLTVPKAQPLLLLPSIRLNTFPSLTEL